MRGLRKSQSTTSTRIPASAKATARLAVTVEAPSPALGPAIINTRTARSATPASRATLTGARANESEVRRKR